MNDPHEPSGGQPWSGRAPVRPRPARPEPYPAQPPPRSRAGRLALGLALALVAAMLVFAGLGLTLLPDENAPRRAVATTPAAVATSPAVPGLGQPARDGALEFVVEAVTCGHPTEGSALLHRTAQGQFCEVRLRVRNVGTHARVFTGRLQKAHGADGATYTDDLLAELYANTGNQTFLKEINPGNQVRGILVFDIPKGARITSMELHDSPLSGGVTVAVRPAAR